MKKIPCSNCRGGQFVVSHPKYYHYTDSGLDNVYLLGGVELYTCDACGQASYSIYDIEGLHRELALILIQKLGPLNSKEFRYLRSYLEFSAKDFSAEIDKTPKTISEWETGKSPIPGVVDHLIRRMVATNKKMGNYQVRELSEKLDNPKKIGRIEASMKAKVWTVPNTYLRQSHSHY